MKLWRVALDRVMLSINPDQASAWVASHERKSGIYWRRSLDREKGWLYCIPCSMQRGQGCSNAHSDPCRKKTCSCTVRGLCSRQAACRSEATRLPPPWSMPTPHRHHSTINKRSCSGPRIAVVFHPFSLCLVPFCECARLGAHDSTRLQLVPLLLSSAQIEIGADCLHRHAGSAITPSPA